MKLNVLYVFGGEQASGAEIVIERLMSNNAQSINAHLFISPGTFAQQKISHNPLYKVTLVPDLRKLNRSYHNPLTLYFFAIKNYFTISKKVISYCSKHKIDAVHANTIVPASYLIPAIIFARLTGSRLKWLWSDHDLRYFSVIDHLLSSLCVTLYNKTLVVSNVVKMKYHRQRKISIVYNGLNTSEFRENNKLRNLFREKIHIDEQEFCIGIAGVICPRKGQLQLIDVFKKILLTHKHVTLLIAGSVSDSSPYYTDMVMTEIGNNLRIRYMGWVTDMPEFYNGCDIVVNNTNKRESEPLGTTIYEAMACKKVVIAADTGGSREIIDDEQEGFLFQPENANDLYEKLMHAIKNHAELDTIRKKASEKVFSRFNIEKMKIEYNQILQLICRK